MSNALMERVDNRLAARDDLVLMMVKVQNPVEPCCGGVMSSPLEQNTMMGLLMLRRSIRRPSEVRSSPLESLSPTNSSSAIHCISSALSRIRLPHHFSKSRKRGASVST